ncbi:MAG: 50S ribosomal protein L22 [Parcubacteria group bacterium GW2011_GWB1_52_7]|nr:MAG: 50S ribosomal protein L22 [Parcubacteria group bacterium GW2011_GWB1_52_7]
MEVTAKLQHLRMAPRKVRLVASMLKGLPAAEALTELRHLPKRASLPIEKLLRSALANAKHNFHLDEKNLRVKLAIHSQFAKSPKSQKGRGADCSRSVARGYERSSQSSKA